MVFDIITIFPRIFDSYISESIIKRAQQAGTVCINVHNLRDHTSDPHKKVDDTPYGGGAGMVLKVEPVYQAVQSIKDQVQESELKVRTILLSAKGKKLTQKEVQRLAGYDKLILICGRYEGVDERVRAHIADEELSIGEYVLTGGELPAMVIVDSVARLLPGVLGNEDSAQFESHSLPGVLEHPHYTKPEDFHGWRVPSVLLSGNHAKVKEWRDAHSKKIKAKE